MTITLTPTNNPASPSTPPLTLATISAGPPASASVAIAPTMKSIGFINGMDFFSVSIYLTPGTRIGDVIRLELRNLATLASFKFLVEELTDPLLKNCINQNQGFYVNNYQTLLNMGLVNGNYRLSYQQTDATGRTVAVSFLSTYAITV
jgi:hypothetical protein